MKCIDEEIPFEIPQGWEWERIGNVFFVTKLAGFEYTKFFTKEALSASNPIPIVRAQNVRMGFFEENKNEAISEMLSNQLERSALNKKCLLMTFIGAGIGDTAGNGRDFCGTGFSGSDIAAGGNGSDTGIAAFPDDALFGVFQCQLDVGSGLQSQRGGG